MQFGELAKTFSLKNLPESQVELVGEFPFETLGPYRATALEHIAMHLELPGFRPGKVPTDMARKYVGEVAVLEEAAEMLVKDFYPEIIEAHKLDAIGRPEIKVTKLAPGNPVGLTIRTSVYPTVEVNKNWKILHEQVPGEQPLPATEEEVQKTLENLRKSRAPKPEEGKELVLPELNDAFAKSLGAFENLAALKEQIKKGITEEKTRAGREARRGKLIEKLLEANPLAVPHIFIESELDKIMAQMREDISRMGIKFEDYLKHANKTEEGVRNDFRVQAEKRAKLQLLLNKLSEEENIVADSEAVEAELKHATEHFPNAKPELVRIHIETVLRNEKVLKLLEGEKG